MKKLIILLTVMFLPLFAFAQTPVYNFDTVKKFDRIIQILKNAKSPFMSYSWWVTGTASGTDGFTLQRYYDTDRIKQLFESEGLDTFLADENNRIILSAVADYVIDHRVYTFHNDYEALLTIGIDPLEAAVRTSGTSSYLNSALENDIIYYYHCYTNSYVSSMGGHVDALKERREIEAQTNEEEVAAIQNKLENEKPLVKEFKKEMNRLRKEERRLPLKKLKKQIAKTMNTEYMKEVAKGIESFVNNK